MNGGRKKTPTKLMVVRGNPSGRPLNLNEPETPGPLGDSPSGWTGEQRALWHEVVNSAPIGLLTKSDRILVELTVRNLAQVRASPEINAAQSAELRRCLGEMGMTPSERTRLVVPKNGEKNPFNDM